MTISSILWFLAIGVVFYFVLKNGGCCGGHSDQGHGGHNHGAGHAGGTGGSHSSDFRGPMELQMTKDPVCGMAVAEGDTSLTSEYMHRTFHFCSERCRKLFDLHPNNYVKPVHG